MSERTAPALKKLDALTTALDAQPAQPDRAGLMEELAALRRAVAAFHMEAIRFRMHSVERRLKVIGDASALQAFDELRHELEAAGFHTRSHSAPGT